MWAEPELKDRIEGRVVSRRYEAFDDGRRVEQREIDGKANLLQLVADDRRRALQTWPSFLRDNRESRRLSARIFEHAVAVAIGQTD